ncbi:hypothetical protein DYB28_014695 [Aphanomyces astaci]|uniref:Uncharacterized protein n=1 Tax=Aphanomyces astaci TaxID=112090 RepID=A0A396ZSJ4_APHAT|nr:hypothetical protein DYB25_013846 [Aphanomyces astaci]RHY03341.1 hypothetical protein DYB36_000550 [Aphanomyces astaci]RHY93246.1 hypothetical protein DYB31_001698 [Aphanomyces astaci]RLO02145.1 hypothetical protein DYB28_014695 [Aphanomyces astaci]
MSTEELVEVCRVIPTLPTLHWLELDMADLSDMNALPHCKINQVQKLFGLEGFICDTGAVALCHTLPNTTLTALTLRATTRSLRLAFKR